MNYSLPLAALATLVAVAFPISTASAAGYDIHTAIAKQQIRCSADGGAFGRGPEVNSFVCQEELAATTCFYTDIDSHCVETDVGARRHSGGSGDLGGANAADVGNDGGDVGGGGFEGGILQPAT